jgi:hypothetical protein
MKRLLKVLVLLLCSVSAVAGYAQTVKGIISDTTGKAVSYASVSLKNGSASIVAYTSTDSKGNFVLQVPAGTAVNDLTVEVNSMGFQKQSKPVSNFSSPLNFVLAVSPNLLQEVTVNGRPHLKTSGDTISYKVSEFSGKNDRLIGDVLKKMPGIAVAADGTISYNGKAISSMYIDGDNLLDDKYNIGTNSIPNGVVDDVQVIENNQPVKMLQNKVLGDDVALNLTIKKNAKLQLVGREGVAGGLPGNYDVDLNAMMFKAKYKAINYLQANNTGSDVQNNLVSHNMMEGQRTDNNKPTSLLSFGSVNNPNIARSRYLFNKGGIVNFNNLLNFKKGQQLRMSLSYLHDSQRQNFSQNTQIFLPNDTVNYTETQQNKFRPDLLQSRVTWNVNKQNYFLNNVLIVNYSHRSNLSLLNTSPASLNQSYTDNSADFSNEFNILKPLKSGNIMELYSYLNHISSPETRIIEPGNNAALLNNGNPYAQLLQTVNIPSWFTNNYLSYKIPKGSITQSYKAGFSIQSQELNSVLNTVQLNSTISSPDSAMNQLNWMRRKLYAEAAYDLPGTIWKVTLTLPLSLQQIHYSDNLYATDKSLKGLYFSPQLRVKYQVGKENSLNFSYNYRNNVGDIQSIYPGRILTDYRTLYANNADLAENKVQRASLGFSFRKAITLLFFNVNASYSRTSANNIASSIITNNILQRIALPLQNSADTWSLGTYASKYSFKLRSTFSAGADWQISNSNQIQNKILLPYQTVSKMFNAGAETKISTQISLSYKGTISMINSRSSVAAPGYHIKQLVQQGAISYNPIDDLSFKLSGDNYLTQQPQANDLNYSFVDASMKYRFKKMKTDLELNIYNLLNVKNYNILNLSANTFTSGAFALPGRIALVKLTFNI